MCGLLPEPLERGPGKLQRIHQARAEAWLLALGIPVTSCVAMLMLLKGVRRTQPLADEEKCPALGFPGELSCGGHGKGLAFSAGESCCSGSPSEVECFPRHLEFL